MCNLDTPVRNAGTTETYSYMTNTNNHPNEFTMAGFNLLAYMCTMTYELQETSDGVNWTTVTDTVEGSATNLFYKVSNADTKFYVNRNLLTTNAKVGSY